jgi:hypothetical protein
MPVSGMNQPKPLIIFGQPVSPVEGKRERRKEAGDVADRIFDEILQKTTQQAALEKKVADALKPKKVKDQLFIPYLLEFWTPEVSMHV